MKKLSNSSDVEVLSTVVGKLSAESLLQHFKTLRAVMTAPIKDLEVRPAIGKVKALKIKALLEISNRFIEQTLDKGAALTSPQITQRYLSSKLRDREAEVFSAILLDSQHRVLKYVELAHGTIDGAAVYPREVAKTVLKENAAAVIFAHNHPSGIAEASQADKAITERLVKSLKLFDVRVLDHIIVGDGEFTSFAEKGWL